MPLWEGVISAIITPMKDGGEKVDAEAMRSYLDFIVEKGVDGVFVGGTTGEGPLLSLEERKQIAEVAVEKLKGKVKVIVHTGGITTEESIRLTKHSCEIGADAAGIVLPYFYGLDDEAILNHFVRIADAVPEFPLFIYNIPQCTCNNLSPELFERLLERVQTIVGVKTSNPDIFQIQEYVRVAKDRCSVFVGCDGLIFMGLCAGAKGIVSGNASCFPEPFVKIYRAFKGKDLEKARECQLVIDKVRETLGDGRYISSFKKALQLRGVKVGSVRAPHRELSQEEVVRLKESLKALELI